jgi:hypothetical protein
MFKNHVKQVLSWAFLLFSMLVLVGVLAFNIPSVRSRLSWRVDIAMTYLRGVIHPVKPFPTAAEAAVLPIQAATSTPTPHPTLNPDLPTATIAPTATPQPSPTPIPGKVDLPAPLWELQGANNCGPATLALYLRFYNWEGSQEDIAQVVKPLPEDRNVNPEELVQFVRTHDGWLNAEFRVGGDLKLLKQLIAAGFPVMIEESFYFETPYWPNDDLWAAHYLLLTGYDETAQTFTGQDSFHGPNQVMSASMLDSYWQIFNRVYLLVYPPAQETALNSILGDNVDPDLNRQHALEVSQVETQSQPNNAYTWFNLGSNLVYFERYGEAATAYDKAPTSEEALLWHGWAMYRMGKKAEAVADWQKALEYHPGYQDAQYALDFNSTNP